jgi:hypothetical protein
MRLAPLLALLVLAPALHAQGTPDPTPPEAYYPLHVGDQWEYRDHDPAPDSYRYPYERRTVTKDTVVTGLRYFVVREQRFRPQGSGTWDISEGRSVLRFDTAAANVKRLFNGGANEEDVLRCRLDLPIPDGGGSAPCSEGDMWSYRVSPDTVVYVGGETVVTSARTSINYMGADVLAAGIGSLGYASCEVFCYDVRLEYVRVGGVTYGQKIAGLPNEPDPTPPEDYYPLAVGNEWQYEDCQQEGPPCNLLHEYVRRTVERDTVIAGARYFVEVQRRYTTASVPLGRSERLLRFRGATLVRRDGAADVPVSCPLDADFDDDEVACPGRFNETVRVFAEEPDPSHGTKVYETSSDSWEGYTAGIGLMREGVWASYFQLRYARVGGEVVFGSVIVADEAAAPAAPALALRAAPNPTSGPLSLTVTLPEAQTATVEAFDALGRRVWQTTAALAAGPQTLPLDASAWAPGVYVVRATAGQATATVRVVRR